MYTILVNSAYQLFIHSSIYDKIAVARPTQQKSLATKLITLKPVHSTNYFKQHGVNFTKAVKSTETKIKLTKII